jgi:hypothetical protein
MLLKALVKRFHHRAATLLGESQSADEARLIEAKDAAIVQPQSRCWARIDRGPSRLNRRRLAALTHNALTPICGLPLDNTRNGERFRICVMGWDLTTQVVFSANPLYLQSIRADERSSLEEGISFLCWMGLGGQTDWDLAVNGDEEDVVGAMRDACERFALAAPGLLAGLS